jgi:hypothetical protein
MEYKSSGLIEVAQLLRAYLTCNHGGPKTVLSRQYLKLAKALILTSTKRDKWTLFDPAGVAERLEAAGLNPLSMEVEDPKRWAWAWYQLKTTSRFSMKKQIALMASSQEPPPIEPFKFATQKLRDEIADLVPYGPARKSKPGVAISNQFSTEFNDRLRGKNVLS